jgi:hypothetical protein
MVGAKSTLYMIFKCDNGNAATITLPDPRTDLTETQVTDVMNTIIAKNIFVAKGSELTEIKDMYVRTISPL